MRQSRFTKRKNAIFIAVVAAVVASLMGNGPYFDTRVKDGTYSVSGLFTDVTMPFVEARSRLVRKVAENIY